MAALGVIMGAFGAHGLESQLSADRLEIYKTAVDYHLYHALGLIVLGTVIKVTAVSRTHVTGRHLLLTLSPLLRGLIGPPPERPPPVRNQAAA